MKKLMTTVDGQMYGHANLVAPLESPKEAKIIDTHPRPTGDCKRDERIRDMLVLAKECD